MSYIGKAPGFGIRNRYYYTATSSQTLFSGADDNGQTLAYADSKYLDVYLNGVSLVAGTDYTATTLTSVSLTTGAAASDIVEIVAYDIFSVADTVSAANGGTFNGNITIDGDLTASSIAYPTSDGTSGQVITTDGSGTLSFTTIASDKIEEGNSSVEVVDTGTGHVAITTDGSERVRVNSSGDVGVGTASPNTNFVVLKNGSLATHPGIPDFTASFQNTDNTTEDAIVGITSSTSGSAKIHFGDTGNVNVGVIDYDNSDNSMRFSTSASETMRIDSSGNLLVGKTSSSVSTVGAELAENGSVRGTVNGGACAFFNRTTNDGDLIVLRQDNSTEGTISVSGTAVSYNGGHLSRWSRLTDDSKDTSIVKGTVMTNLDEMVVWSHETTYWTEDDELPVDEDGNSTVAVGDVKKEAYTEDNEQLNKMAVSSVEGDSNVAGVFVNWDNDDDFNDMNIAMTGDMVIRIAQGTTVQRGDLLMSAGDGTAKPQGDDIVRSKTIAKVTSTHVSHTYDDGSYLVPCVLMAC